MFRDDGPALLRQAEQMLVRAMPFIALAHGKSAFSANREWIVLIDDQRNAGH